MDILQNRLFVVSLLNFGYLVSFKVLDRGFIELSGPYGISRIVKTYGKNLIEFQTGQITHYLFFMVLGLCLFGFILLFANLYIDYRLIGLFFILATFLN